MRATGRQLKIRELLESQEFVDLETLCRELGSSESSVRRDLTQLEAAGVLKRVYGGAMAIETRGHALDFDWQSTRMAEEKRRIGQRAAELVEDGQTLILDGGSTTAAVARALLEKSLHVITNSLAIADIFSEARRIEVTLTGGYLYPRLRTLLGPICEQMLAGVRADLLIMGIGGVTAEGFSNSNSLVVGPERRMMEAASRVVVVADHTKFGRGAVSALSGLSAAQVVVSDSGLEEAHRGLLAAAGVELVLA